LYTTKSSSFLPNALLLSAVLLLLGCVPDAAPDAFSFASQTRVAAATHIESESVTVSGINIPAPLSITGGEYSIDGKAYRSNPGTIKVNQQVRIRVLSSSESSGEVSATLTIGGVSGTFTVRTANFTGRVEAEAASLTGGASAVADPAASKGKTVLVGSAGRGISTDDSVDAQALIIAYRTDTAGTLEATVNGAPAGRFTLRPTAGAYATASAVVAVQEGDVVAIASPSTAGSSETYLDYVEFAASPFRTVSTLTATNPTTSDGISVGPNGDIYLSGGAGAVSGAGGHQILRITPEGEVTVFASGLGSANGSDFDSSGNLYVADFAGGAVRKITPEGVMTTFASGLDGPGGVWVDQNDNVLVTIYGFIVRGGGATVLSITPDGTVSTYASGPPLQDVIGIVGDDNGQIYAANWGSGVIFNITGGNVSELAQTGSTLNHMCYSHGVIFAPSPGGAVIRRVKLDGTVEHLTGTSVQESVDGPLASAGFARPNSCDIAEDGSVLYVMDRATGLLRKVASGTP
jgi:sugar lactone lactonase YvrE